MLLLAILLTIKPDLPFAKRLEQVYTLRPSQANFTLSATNGSVRFEVGKPGQIIVKQLIRADEIPKLEETKLETNFNKVGLELRVVDDFKSPGKPSTRYAGALDYSPPVIEITVTVPPSLNLKIDTTNASVSIGRISGRIQVRSNNGEIHYQASALNADAISAKSRNGEVRAEAQINISKDPKVSLESVNGNITIEKPLPVTSISGAEFWNGKSFDPGSWFIVDGVFTKRHPNLPMAVLGLENRYIAPAYGDAHCHHIDGEYLAGKMSGDYLAQGTLYVQSMGNHSSSRRESEKVVNRPRSIDVRFANGGFTSGWGHPAFLYENLAAPADPKMNPQQRSDFIKSRPRRELGDSYWLAETPEELEKVWPRYLATDPDLTKIFLVNSTKRQENTNGLAGSIGLSGEMAKVITAKAHRAGLKVYAHVDTKTDVEIALAAGVDGLAHMPGYGMGASNNPDFSLTGLRPKAGTKLIVQPTTSLASNYSKGTELLQVKATQRENLAALRRVGATFVIGSDVFFSTQKTESLDWLELGFSPEQVFRSLVTTTPQSIFPNRAIGEIREGYEANFVVLAQNPLTKLESAFSPTKVYKHGVQIR